MSKKYLLLITSVALTIVATIIVVIFYRTHISIGHLLTSQKSANVSNKQTYTTSNGIRFEIATTTAMQERGLSGRPLIPNNYAMLFVFPKLEKYGFWMKDMISPIDILWLSDNGTIISIEKSVQPNTYPHVFYPSTKARYVLEVRSGFSALRGWHIGSVINLPYPYGENFSK